MRSEIPGIPKHIWETAITLDELIPAEHAFKWSAADSIHWAITEGLITYQEACELTELLIGGEE